MRSDSKILFLKCCNVIQTHNPIKCRATFDYLLSLERQQFGLLLPQLLHSGTKVAAAPFWRFTSRNMRHYVIHMY